MSFELTNEQRAYLGLEPTNPNWAKITLNGDTYRPDSIIYFDGDVIKKHVVSTNEKYEEKQYNDRTRERNYLLPATSRGKEKKLTASVLESHVVGDELHVQLVDIAVSPHHQKQGLSRVIMERLKHFIDTRIPECANVSLFADVDWLYQKFGFDRPKVSIGMFYYRE